jgi:hypothetical protein
MHIPLETCNYCQFITYLWCITNVSLVFAEIVFDEAGSYGFRADNIRRNSESILTHICLMAGGHSVKAPIHDQFAQAF